MERSRLKSNFYSDISKYISCNMIGLDKTKINLRDRKRTGTILFLLLFSDDRVTAE